MDESLRTDSPEETVMQEEPCHLFNIPKEMLWEITTYLSVPEVSVLMRTNKRLCESLYPQIIKQAIHEDEKIHNSAVNLRYAAMKNNRRVFEGILEKTKTARLTEKLMGTWDDDHDDKELETTTVHVVTVHCSPIYLQKILEKGVDVNILDVRERSAGHTPIQRAAKHGCLGSMKVLIAFGANVNDQVTGTGPVTAWTPIHRATARRHLEMVHFLLSAGADPRVRMGPTLTTTILIRALEWTEGLELILGMHKFEQPMINEALIHAVYHLMDFYHPAACLIAAGATVPYHLLCIACRRESMPTAKSVELIATYASESDRDERNYTALHQVVHAEIARVVAQRIPGIVNAKGPHGWTPLQYLYDFHWPSQLREVEAEPLLRQRRSDVALALIQNGARIDISLGPYKRNVIFSACEMGHDDVVEKILDLDCTLADSRDTIGNTPLHMAASSWDNGTLECLHLLLEASNGVDAQNYQGQTALHCTSCPIPIPHAPDRIFLDSDDTGSKVVALIQAGANIFIKGKRDWSLAPRTALVEAISTSNIPSADALVDKGVVLLQQSNLSQRTTLDVEKIRQYLTEALHVSVENGYLEFVRRMLQPDTECSLRNIGPNGDNIFHCLARGAISMALPGLAMIVGWRILGYQMPAGWSHPFLETEYTYEGRPHRYFYQLADEICEQRHLLPLALEKNAAGYSAFDLYKHAFPMMDWNSILKKIQHSLSRGVDVCMPIPTQPTVNLAEDYENWISVNI